MIKARKQIIVPTTTLVEQWRYYIDTGILHAKGEIRILTYSGWRDTNEEYALTICDECQRSPADTFSRIAVIKTKYRLGLSARPHREDGQESYIFAFTGLLIGLNWQKYMKTVGRSCHPINVHVLRSSTGKMKERWELADLKKKTLNFCDSIELRKLIAGDPFLLSLHGVSKTARIAVTRKSLTGS